MQEVIKIDWFSLLVLVEYSFGYEKRIDYFCYIIFAYNVGGPICVFAHVTQTHITLFALVPG